MNDGETLTVYEGETPTGIPLRRPKRAKKNSIHLHGQTVDQVTKSGPAATLYDPDHAQKKASVETGTVFQLPSSVVANESSTMPGCTTNPLDVVDTGKCDLPELFAQKYKILPLPSMDLEIEASEEQLSLAPAVACLPSASSILLRKGDRNDRLVSEMHASGALATTNVSMQPPAFLARSVRNNSK